MSNRHAVRARKIPVSITLSPDDYDFIEMLINSRRYANRTQVIERGLRFFVRSLSGIRRFWPSKETGQRLHKDISNHRVVTASSVVDLDEN